MSKIFRIEDACKVFDDLDDALSRLIKAGNAEHLAEEEGREIEEAKSQIRLTLNALKAMPFSAYKLVRLVEFMEERLEIIEPCLFDFDFDSGVIAREEIGDSLKMVQGWLEAHGRSGEQEQKKGE